MRRLAVVVAALMTLAACSGEETNSFGFMASSQGSIGTGEQRILIGVRDLVTNEMLASPDITPTAILRDAIGSPLGEYEGEFIWAIPDVSGLYAFYVDIPGPATYQLDIDAGSLGALTPIGFVAAEDPLQVTAGDEAPASESRTLDDDDLANLTTDPDPDPTLYEMTVAEAVSSGPSVIVFATPAWCTSQTCGPMLDQVKDVKSDYPSLNYVHVEIYENINVTDSADLILVDTVVEWGLPTEPWLYVTDGDGTVIAVFEGALSDEELKRALESVSS